mmetsp:Transcript_28448/g.69347  ORF Transcript_28448/g.69347 Transcript_28448/m.69347 type:complete len:254 (+) Transcript_28448:1360-2121(+)
MRAAVAVAFEGDGTRVGAADAVGEQTHSTRGRHAGAQCSLQGGQHLLGPGERRGESGILQRHNEPRGVRRDCEQGLGVPRVVGEVPQRLPSGVYVGECALFEMEASAVVGANPHRPREGLSELVVPDVLQAGLHAPSFLPPLRVKRLAVRAPHQRREASDDRRVHARPALLDRGREPAVILRGRQDSRGRLQGRGEDLVVPRGRRPRGGRGRRGGRGEEGEGGAREHREEVRRPRGLDAHERRPALILPDGRV